MATDRRARIRGSQGSARYQCFAAAVVWLRRRPCVDCWHRRDDSVHVGRPRGAV